MSGKIADVFFHGGMPEPFEMEVVHFFQSVLRRPMLKGDAIRGDKDASTIVAKPTMYVERFLWPFLEKREELNELFVLWRRPATGADVNELHGVRFCPLFFGCDGTLALAAQIDNGVDTDFFQLLDTFFVRLRTAVEKIVDLAYGRKSIQLNFLCERRPGRPSGAGGTSRVWTSGKKESGGKQSKKRCARKLHNKRAIKHLEENCKWKSGKRRKEVVPRNKFLMWGEQKIHHKI